MSFGIAGEYLSLKKTIPYFLFKAGHFMKDHKDFLGIALVVIHSTETHVTHRMIYF
jgi:hypothetical protein